MKPSTLPLLGIVLLSLPSFGQLFLNTPDSTYIINFDSTLVGVNQSSFAGLGLSPSPSAGQLNSNAWSLSGFSYGEHNYGDYNTENDYARGVSSGTVSTGGMYAFQVGENNFTLGIQPTSTDFSPGNLTLKLLNKHCLPIGKIELSYDLWINNDKDYASKVIPYFIQPNGKMQFLPDYKISSPQPLDSNAQWQLQQVSITVNGILISPNSSFEIGWHFDDVSGSGSRDEFGIDNIKIRSQRVSYCQSFENEITDNLVLKSGENLISNNPGSSDHPSNQRVYQGLRSFQSNGQTDTLAFYPFLISHLADAYLSLRVSASSLSPFNGLDQNDSLIVKVKYPSSQDSILAVIKGRDNATWSFYPDSNQVHYSTSTWAGATFQPNAGGSRDSERDVPHLIQIPIAPHRDSMVVSLLAQSDHQDEIWNIDNLSIVAKQCDTLTKRVTNFQITELHGKKLEFSFSRPENLKSAVIIREDYPVSRVPSCNQGYTPNANFKSGENLGGGNYLTHLHSDTTLLATGLSPNKKYHLRITLNKDSAFSTQFLDTSFITCYSNGVGLYEKFDFGHDTLPFGWEFVNIAEDGSDAYSGASLKFNSSSDSLISPELCYPANAVKFWIKGQGNTVGSYLIIKGSSGADNWTTIDTISPLPTTASDNNWVYLGDSLVSSFNRFMWIYHKSFGNCDIDEIAITCGNTLGKSYTWNNTAADSLFVNANNYTPNRKLFGLSDTLVFTSNTTIKLPELTSINQLVVSNGSTLVLESDSGSSELILQARENALQICENCTLKLTGDSPVKITLLGNAHNVVGNIEFTGSQAHQIIPLNSALLIFEAGASFINNGVSDSHGRLYPFGESSDLNNRVVFKANASYYSQGPQVKNPFGPSGVSVASFQVGSNFYFDQPTGAPSLSGRVYGNFYYRKPGSSTLQSGNSPCEFDSLIIVDGQLKIKADIPVSINGNLRVTNGDSLYYGPPVSGSITLKSTDGLISTSNKFGLGSNATFHLDTNSRYYLTGSITLGNSFHLKANSHLTLNTGDSISIYGNVYLDSTSQVHIKDDASWIQYPSSLFFGSSNFSVTRKIPDSSSSNQYYLWSSPLTETSPSLIGPSGALSGSRMYSYQSGSTGSEGYIPIINNITMKPGVGYAVFGASAFTATGMINNDTIITQIKSVEGSASYSLIGNPYPSAINAKKFLEDTWNQNALNGTMYLWSYNNQENYSSSKQYIAVNLLGSSSFHRSQKSSETYISSFQAFMVESNSNLNGDSAFIRFTNSMRGGSNANFKQSKLQDIYQNWLYISSPDGDTSSCQYAFSKGFSKKHEAGFDAKIVDNAFGIGLKANQDEYCILASYIPKHLDIIPISVKVPKPGVYHIGGHNTPLLPLNLRAYLLDLETGTSTEISLNSYLSSSLPLGKTHGRFALIFIDQDLSPTHIYSSYNTNYKYISPGWWKRDDVVKALVFNLEGKSFEISSEKEFNLLNLKGPEHWWISIFTKNSNKVIRLNTEY